MHFADDGRRLTTPPRRVAILGMGPTLQDFINLRLQAPGPGGVVDEVWGMNNVITGVKCDVGFIMDDFVEMLERPEKGAMFWDKSNPELMRHCREEATIPILTSKAYRPRYRTACEYPLADVYKSVFGERRGFHFSNTTSYAIAMAWHLGVEEIHLYGTDFAYPWHDPYDRRKYLEEARANVEALLLAGHMLGKFTFHMSARTSLFDTMRGRPFYGYADHRKALPDEMITEVGKEKIENDKRILPSNTRDERTDQARASASDEGRPIQALGKVANGHAPEFERDFSAEGSVVLGEKPGPAEVGLAGSLSGPEGAG